jgi:hypothetical protein
MENKFKTVSELLKDDHFIHFVGKNIAELRVSRSRRPNPKPGFRYKRDWYDRMTQEGIFNSSFFIKNIESIWDKKSSLSSEIRQVILFVCNRALHETVETYSKMEPETK